MTTSNKLFFLFFCVLTFTLIVNAQQKSIAVPNLVLNQYNLFFNPFDQNIPLAAVSYDGDPYQWNTNAQAWGDADTLTSGQGIAMIPKTTTFTFAGTNFKTQIDIKVGYNAIGSITDKAISLSDLIIVENNNLPMQSSVDGFYNMIYKYNPTLGYLDFESTDKMEPGKAYFIEATRSFTIKLKSTTTVTQPGACTTGQIKCAITEQQYLVPTAETLVIEDKMQICKDGQFVDSTCDFGKACRTDSASKSCCQETSPPPLVENGVVLAGARPDPASCG